MVYREQLKRHLSEYKRTRLGIHEDGIWVKNKVAYPHILPQHLYALNILETVRAEYLKYEQIHCLGKHAGFHHLNSSQAMCANLFSPLNGFEESRSTLFLKAVGLPTDLVDDRRFEFCSEQAEGTHFDYYIRYATGTKVYIECKLSESDFGQRQPTDRHRTKLSEVYGPRLHGKVGVEWLVESRFFSCYQLFRNISYLNLTGDDLLVLLLPKANTDLCRKLSILDKAVLPEARQRIRIVYLEEVVRALRAAGGTLGHRVETHYELFAEKYIL